MVGAGWLRSGWSGWGVNGWNWEVKEMEYIQRSVRKMVEIW